jgi:Flp pilus assembly protein CpaB
LLRERSEMTTVVVPARSLTAGEPITMADVDAVEIPTEVVFSDELVSRADVDAGAVYAGRVLRTGEPIPRSSTSGSPQGIDRRTMALPLPDWGAAGGQLEVGDEIDVIDTGGDQPRYIVQRAAIVARSTNDAGGGLAAQRSVWVSIEVTEAQALDVAGVVDEGSFIIVRSGRGS